MSQNTSMFAVAFQYVDKAWLLLPAMYLVFLISRILPSLESYGLIPRQFSGLRGMVTMCLLHDDLKHLVANTVPLIVLIALLIVSSQVSALTTIVLIQFLGAGALWLVGRRANHIGASLLVFGLTGFHVAMGYFQSNVTTIVIAIVVAALYGGTFISSIVPWRQGSSWDGHLCGFLAGVTVAALSERIFEVLPVDAIFIQ